MNLKHEINRLSHLFHDGSDKMQTATEDWSETAKTTAKRAREGFRTGADRMVSAEELVVRHVRSNSGVYILAALLLIGAMIAKLLMERREVESAPLL